MIDAYPFAPTTINRGVRIRLPPPNGYVSFRREDGMVDPVSTS